MMHLSGLPPAQMGLILVGLALPILPNLWSIWHIFHREFQTVHEKMIWFVVAVFVPVFGGLAYLVFGRRRARKPLAPGKGMRA